MKTVGVVAEFNPFHKGHKYILEEARRRTGADVVIVVMSGDFVQRGAPAICDKYSRTQMALDGGADIVFELPVAFATSSAEAFAEGAVKLLHSLGCVDYLCFGSECGDISSIWKLAQLLTLETPEYKERLMEGLKNGLSYPAARARALSIELNGKSDKSNDTFEDSKEDIKLQDSQSELTEVLKNPNNVLAIEYCKALIRLKTRHGAERVMEPITVKREGDGYGEDRLPETGYASASAIRAMVLKDDGAGPDFAKLCKYTTDCTAAFLTEDYGRRLPVSEDDLSDMLGIRLATCTPKALESILDLSEGLRSRILKNSGKPMKFSELAMAVKSKNVTYSAVCRGLLHILLGINSETVTSLRERELLPYARLLGFKRQASGVLRSISDSASCALITKLADADCSEPLLKMDLFAASVYNQVVYSKFETRLKSEYEAGVVRL